MMLRDLGAAAGMSAAKAHRYLVSFQRLGLVVQDEHSTRYDLGPAALKLGLASLERLDAVQLARARMDALMRRSGPNAWRLPCGATTAPPSCTGKSRPRPSRSTCAWAT